ncbi:MAG TPA: flagellar hook-associated protein FlgK [Burkholderiaceae bacterium]|nr:flagellar hook-associated protein FlgK [Burkholderiaceae bacterium]
MSLISIGASALNAAYQQIQITGHNIANVNTPGYHRQTGVQSAVEGMVTGNGYVGRGVQVDTVQRQYDAFLDREVSTTQAAASADQARAQQLTALDRMFANTDQGLGARIDSMRSALADLVNTPADASARSVVMQRASDLAGQVRSTAAQLDSMARDTNLRIGAAADKLNGLLKNLASLNNRIANAAGSGQPPNDLLDQRDTLITEVNKLMGATAYINPDGTANLFASGGQALVVGATAASFGVTQDPLNPARTQLVLKTLGADVPVDSRAIGGGELAGLIRFRDEDLAAAQYRVGQLAAGLAGAFNAQQALGVDATGAAGSRMFELGAPTAGAATTNVGDGQLAVTVADPQAVAASDYEVTWDGSQYVATRLSDGAVTALGGLPQTLDGLTISSAGGTPATGDRFLVRSASAMASGFEMILSSPSRLAAGAPVMPQTASTNAGDVKVLSFNVDDASGGDLASPVTLTFTGAGSFDVSGGGTGDPTGVAYVAGQSISFNGWTIRLTGTPQPGDTVTISPTSSGATDNRNAKNLLDLLDRPLVNGGTFNEAYADLIADVGTRAGSAETAQQMSTQALSNATLARDQVSGVSLDEEAARLMQYQQAYQAAARLIAAAQSMFDTVLSVVDR